MVGDSSTTKRLKCSDFLCRKFISSQFGETYYSVRHISAPLHCCVAYCGAGKREHDNSRTDNWASILLGPVTTGRCYKWTLLPLGPVTTGRCYKWTLLPLNDVATERCYNRHHYNWVPLQLDAVTIRIRYSQGQIFLT